MPGEVKGVPGEVKGVSYKFGWKNKPFFGNFLQ